MEMDSATSTQGSFAIPNPLGEETLDDEPMDDSLPADEDWIRRKFKILGEIVRKLHLNCNSLRKALNSEESGRTNLRFCYIGRFAAAGEILSFY